MTDKLTTIYIFSQIISSAAQSHRNRPQYSYQHSITYVQLWILTKSKTTVMTMWEVSRIGRYKCAPLLHYGHIWHHLWYQSDTLQLRIEQENSVWYFQIPDNTKFLAVQTHSKFSVHLTHYFVEHTLISSKVYTGFASHKSNPSSIPRGIIDS
jgi:hypothetical protein